MLTKKELGIPWKDTGMEWVGSALGDADAVDVNKKLVHFKDKADFIIHAANSHHALVRLLEICYHGFRLEPEDHNTITALLATHTQEEAPDSPVSIQTPVDGNNDLKQFRGVSSP